MCLPDFIEFKQIEEKDAVIGYRNWISYIREDITSLRSENIDYIWKTPFDGPHEVLDSDSGLYSYNYYYYNNNYYYNNYNYYYNYYYNYIGGIIKQWGKVAIHKDGYRSEYAKIDTLFKIKFEDAKGPDEFLRWINEIFNPRVDAIAEYYKCKTVNWQDFVESQK